MRDCNERVTFSMVIYNGRFEAYYFYDRFVTILAKNNRVIELRLFFSPNISEARTREKIIRSLLYPMYNFFTGRKTVHEAAVVVDSTHRAD